MKKLIAKKNVMKPDRTLKKKKIRIDYPVKIDDLLLELITPDGNLSRKAIIKPESEIQSNCGCCKGLYFFRIVKGEKMLKSGKLLL